MIEPTFPDLEDRTGLVSTTGGRAFCVDRGPVRGNRPPVVLLHDWLGSSYDWRKVHEDLCRGADPAPGDAGSRRVVAMDLVGAGSSDHPEPSVANDYRIPWQAKRVVDLLDRLGLEQAVVVGHGLGGTVATHLAAAHPGRVQALALVAPYVVDPPHAMLSSWLSLPAVGELAMLTLRRSAVEQFLARGRASGQVEPRELDVVWDRLGREGATQAALSMLRALGDLRPTREALRQVQAPTLVLGGERDRVVPLSHLRDCAAWVGETAPERVLWRHSTLDGCGHSPALERPAATLAILREFLAATA